MKPTLKSVLVPTVSAVVGGIAVVAALKMSPALLSKIGEPKAKSSANRNMIFDEILSKQKDIHKQFDSIFNDDLFGSSNPFEDMKKMREQMRKRMETFEKPGTTSNPFDSWFSEKFGGGSIDDIAMREDHDFVYYDIKIHDLNSTSLDTKIEHGYITITGTVEKKNIADDKNDDFGISAHSIFKSTFNRTFPLPENVDQNKMEMLPEKDKVVLKFPKVKS